MRKVAFVMGILALVGMSGIAAADGYRNANVAPPVSYNWSGVYFGSQVGYGWGTADIRENLSIAAPPGTPLLSAGDKHDIDGWLAGVHLGAMKQFGSFVVGTDLALSGADINGSTGDCAGLTTASGGAIGVHCSSKVNWLATGLGRGGYAWDRFLVYGSLGYAIAGVDHNITLNVPATTPLLAISWSKSDVAHGIAFGGGLQYGVTRDLTVGIDYVHANLESRGEGIVLGGAITTGKRDVDLDTITARLSYRFGGECCAAAAPLK